MNLRKKTVLRHHVSGRIVRSVSILYGKTDNRVEESGHQYATDLPGNACQIRDGLSAIGREGFAAGPENLPQQQKEKTMRTSHSRNRKELWKACEALRLVSDYARLCETYDVPDPEMSGLAETCALVREHLERLEQTEATERKESR